MTNKMKGKVYLVGAGPGDPKLITLKAVEILAQADIVFFDYLANEDILQHCSSSCEKIYVGKKGNFKSPSQKDISELLIQNAHQGLLVVRLKGGDPFLFGRGGEEALSLKEAGISFEIIPGVSSLISVPAHAGIPLTHRDFTSEVAILTGHRSKEKNQDLKWDHIKSFRTIVIFMGTAELNDNLDELMKAGLDSSTPAALISWGTYNRQKTLVSSVGKLASEVEKQNFKPPALLVIGEVVKLRSELNWFESRPLFGKKIIVTRSSHQNSILNRDLEEKGAQVISIPMIEIEPLSDLSLLDQSILNLSNYNWIFFTSQNSVDIFWNQLKFLGKDIRALSSLKIGVVGSATGKRVIEKGGWIDLKPIQYHGEALAQLCQEEGLKNAKVLFPRALKGRNDLVDILKTLDCDVDLIPVYKNSKPNLSSEGLQNLLKEENPDWILFTSSSTVDHFVEILGKDHLEWIQKSKISCFGPMTEKTLSQYQLKSHLTPKNSTIEDLIDGLISYEK